MKQDISVLKKLNILIVEDDAIILDELAKTASMFFSEVFCAKNGQDAYATYGFEKIDLIVTDIKMPVIDGVTLIKKVREKDYETPIIVLSSYSEQETLLKVLNLGVSGYLVKPIEFEEFVQALQKATRRYANNDKQIFALNGDRFFNRQTKELFYDGKNVDLGTKELALLELFIENADKTIGKDAIISTLWPLDEITDSALKGVLNRLRKKIGEEHIVNVKGFGWKFSVR